MKITEQDILMINQVFKDFEKFLKTGDGDYFYIDRGLCHNIFDLIYDNTGNIDVWISIDEAKDKLFNSWKYFSGNLGYPVPFRQEYKQDESIISVINDNFDRFSERTVYLRTNNMYDKNTDYGKLRLDLYQHIKDNIFDVINEL